MSPVMTVIISLIGDSEPGGDGEGGDGKGELNI